MDPAGWPHKDAQTSDSCRIGRNAPIPDIQPEHLSQEPPVQTGDPWLK